MHPLLLTLALLHGADISSTIDLSHRYGGKELNPFMPQDMRTITALSTAETVVQVYALNKLNARHPKLAKTLAMFSIGLEGYIVYHNGKQYR